MKINYKKFLKISFKKVHRLNELTGYLNFFTQIVLLHVKTITIMSTYKNNFIQTNIYSDRSL